MGETAWGTPAGECRVPLSPNLQESSSAQGPAVRSRPSSPSSKSLRGQWPRDGGCGYPVRGGVLPSPVRGGGSPSLCGPRQRCPRNPPGAEKPDTDPSPGPDAAPPVSPQSVPSGPGVGSAQPGPRPAIRGRRPSHLPPGPRSFELHQVGSPAARAAPTPRPHPPAPGTVPTAPRGSRRDEPGRGSATPATVGVRGAAPQSPGTRSCGAGLPLSPSQTQ